MTDTPTPAARRILATAILLGLLADLALRNLADGLGWTLWVITMAGAAFVVATRQKLRLTNEALAWLGVAVACAVAFAWRDADELRVANVLGTLVSIAMFSMCVCGVPAGSLFDTRVRDVLTAGVFAVRDLLFGTPVLVARDGQLHALPALRGGASWAALRAVLLTTPFVLAFVLLLSRADPVFAGVFRLPAIDVQRIASHVLLTGVFAWTSAGWLRGSLLGVAWRARLPERVPLRLGRMEITTSLTAVIAVFGLFVALQIRWLFGGAEVVLATTGLTVAEYARRGFFELVAVALLVMPLILGTGAAIDDERVARWHRRLSRVLLVLLAAIIASALLRMQLYVTYFGLSTDRFYATVVMLWLAVVFAAMAVTLLRGQGRVFAGAAVIAGFVTLLVLNVIDPERLIARVNVQRPSGERGVDYTYLAGLSGDAAPRVVEALKLAAPSADACKAATVLRTRWVSQPHISWNLGAWRGRQSVVEGLTEARVRELCAVAPAAS